MLHAFGKYIIDTCPHFPPSRDDKLHIGVHSSTLNELRTEFRVRNGGLSFMGGRNRWQRAFDWVRLNWFSGNDRRVNVGLSYYSGSSGMISGTLIMTQAAAVHIYSWHKNNWIRNQSFKKRKKCSGDLITVLFYFFIHLPDVFVLVDIKILFICDR